MERRWGRRAAAPSSIPDVAPGRHEVTVEKSGYTTTKQEFTLAAGQSLPLSLTLSPVSVEVPRPEGGKSIEIGGTGEPPERRGADTGPDRLLDCGRRHRGVGRRWR